MTSPYIRQGTRFVSDYAIEFWTLVATAGWTQFALIGAFQKGLEDRIVDCLMTCETPSSLEGLIDLAIHIDSRLAERRDYSLLQNSTPPAAVRYLI